MAAAQTLLEIRRLGGIDGILRLLMKDRGVASHATENGSSQSLELGAALLACAVSMTPPPTELLGTEDQPPNDPLDLTGTTFWKSGAEVAGTRKDWRVSALSIITGLLKGTIPANSHGYAVVPCHSKDKTSSHPTRVPRDCGGDALNKKGPEVMKAFEGKIRPVESNIQHDTGVY